jgi:hypothetical protein
LLTILQWCREESQRTDTNLRWRVGDGGITTDDISILGLVHVSRRSWQILFQRRRQETMPPMIPSFIFDSIAPDSAILDSITLIFIFSARLHPSPAHIMPSSSNDAGSDGVRRKVVKKHICRQFGYASFRHFSPDTI